MTDRLERLIELVRRRQSECRIQVRSADAARYLPEDVQKENYIIDAKLYLADRLQLLYLSLLMAFEELGYPSTAEALQAVMERERPKLGELAYYEDEDNFPYSIGLNALDQFVEQLEALEIETTGVQAEQGVLLRILEQLPEYIENHCPAPGREKDVQDSLEPVLKLAFPSTLREIAIPQQTKVYKPDFGVSEIGSAVEVKYLDSAARVGAVLGELYEDMKGYAGSAEWHSFFGLIYATGAYLTQHRLEAEAKRVQTPKNWNVRVVVGPGERVKRAADKTPKAKPTAA